MNLKVLPLAAYLFLFGHPVWADCGASLATGIDVSGSVSADELRMQVDGIASALRSPAVQQAFATQNCVRIAVFTWGENPPTLLLDWTEVGSAEQAERAGDAMLAALSTPATGQLTNIAGAMVYAWHLFGQIPPTGRQVLNIVTNGTQNVGGENTDPLPISIQMRAAGITINGLAFGPSVELENYLRENVTGGRSSFVLRVNGADDFAQTYVQKFRMDLAQVQP